MSYRRYNVSSLTGNFTGVTTGAQGVGPVLHIGENQCVIQSLSVLCVLTSTMTSATIGVQWQGSNDNSTWVRIANAPANTAPTLVLTGGTGAAATISVEAPQGAYGWKYCRPTLQWTSTTAGTTNDAWTMGLIYRQLAPGEGAF